MRYIIPGNTFASILLENLTSALDELKELKAPDSEVEEQLRIVNSLSEQLISALNGVEFSPMLESLEKKFIASLEKIDPKRRLRLVGDKDQQTFQECAYFLKECSSAFKELLKEINNAEAEDGYEKLNGGNIGVENDYERPNNGNEYEEIDRSDTESDRSYDNDYLNEIYDDIVCVSGSSESALVSDNSTTSTNRWPNVSDQNGGCFSSRVVSSERRIRAFSEPPANSHDSHSKQFSPSARKVFLDAVNIANRLEKNNLLKLDEFSEKTITRFLFFVKRITKLFCDAFDLFKKIVEESKFHIPLWFVYDDEGKRCLEKAQKLSDILEKVAQQAVALRDAHSEILECAYQPKDAQTKRRELAQRQTSEFVRRLDQILACQVQDKIQEPAPRTADVASLTLKPKTMPKPKPKQPLPVESSSGLKESKAQTGWQKLRLFVLRGDKQSPRAHAKSAEVGQSQNSTPLKPRGKTQ